MFDPAKLVEDLAIKEGAIVADLGCGSGHIAIPLARSTGDEGRVYAIDILEKKLEAVRSAAKMQFLNNVVTYRANLESPGVISQFIKAGTVDVVVIANVLFANDKKEDIISQAASLLKIGGRLAIVDWKNCELPIAPPQELLVDPKKITAMCKAQGLVRERDLSAGDCHWGLEFIKK